MWKKFSQKIPDLLHLHDAIQYKEAKYKTVKSQLKLNKVYKNNLNKILIYM